MKKQITITIAGGKVITLKTYLAAWKTLRSMTAEQRRNTQVKESFNTWYPVTAEQALKQLTSAVHDRINGRADGMYLIQNFGG